MNSVARFGWVVAGACLLVAIVSAITGSYGYVLLNLGLAALNGWLAWKAEGK